MMWFGTPCSAVIHCDCWVIYRLRWQCCDETFKSNKIIVVPKLISIIEIIFNMMHNIYTSRGNGIRCWLTIPWTLLHHVFNEIYQSIIFLFEIQTLKPLGNFKFQISTVKNIFKKKFRSIFIKIWWNHIDKTCQCVTIQLIT